MNRISLEKQHQEVREYARSFANQNNFKIFYYNCWDVYIQHIQFGYNARSIVCIIYREGNHWSWRESHGKAREDFLDILKQYGKV